MYMHMIAYMYTLYAHMHICAKRSDEQTKIQQLLCLERISNVTTRNMRCMCVGEFTKIDMIHLEVPSRPLYDLCQAPIVRVPEGP